MSPLLKKKKGIVDDKYLLRQYCFTSALLAALIMCIMFFFHDNTLLFGDKTVLRMDLYHQYCPLYAEVYDRIISGDSIIYSWTSGLGGNFIGNFFNYCSSPFAFIMFLFGHKNIPEAIAVMILLKAVCASVSFTYYVNKSNNTVKKESVIFGLFYAFSAYFVAYSWNIMWLDAFAFFPLVILGIERIIRYNKPLTYICAMTYTMITNYYMAYMVCILSVMYFLYYYFGHYELASSIKKSVKATIGNLPQSSEEHNAVDDSSVQDVYSEVLTDTDVVATDSDSECSVEAVQTVQTEQNAVINEEKAIPDESAYTESIVKNEVETVESSVTTNKVKLKNRRFWVTGWTFALSSFLCFCLAAFAMIPVIYCLQSSSATSGTFPTESKQYFDIFRFIANHLPGIETTIRSSGDNVIPNVYCGLITVMLLPIYFLSSKIPGKQKVVSAVLLMVCLVGFVLNYFNFIWHGFHMPNDLPYRWSFAYSFFLLLIAYKAFNVLDEFSNKAYIGIGFSVMCFVVLVEKFEVPNADELTILLSVVFALLYVIIFGMLKSPKYRRNAVVGLLFFTVVLEIVVSDTPKIVMQQSKAAYTSDYHSYQEIKEKVESQDSELFFRTELGKLRARMDPSWYGYNGVSTFSSMAYEDTAKLVKKLGFFGNNINSYTYYPNTPVFNSMFNIKYIYDNMNFIETNNYGDDSVSLQDNTLTDIATQTTDSSVSGDVTLSESIVDISNESIIESSIQNSENISVNQSFLDVNSGILNEHDDTETEKIVIEGDNYIDIYTADASNNKFEAFAYNYFLPLIFSVDSAVIDWDYSSADPFAVQNGLVQSTTGVSDVFVPVDATSFDTDNIKNVSLSTINAPKAFSVSKVTNGKAGEANVKIVAEQFGNHYVYVGGSSLKSLKVQCGEFEYSYVTSSISPFILDVGYLEPGDEIVVTYKVPEDKNTASLTFDAVVLNAEKFEEAYNIIKENGTISLNSFEETSFSGTINVTNDNALLWTSIPYDEGWDIYIDGKLMTYSVYDEETKAVIKEGDIVKIGNGLIGIKTDKGEHSVDFRFNARGLKEGLMITAVGIAVVAIILIYKLWLHKFFEKIGYIPIFFRKPDNADD